MFYVLLEDYTIRLTDLRKQDSMDPIHTTSMPNVMNTGKLFEILKEVHTLTQC